MGSVEGHGEVSTRGPATERHSCRRCTTHACKGEHCSHRRPAEIISKMTIVDRSLEALQPASPLLPSAAIPTRAWSPRQYQTAK